MRIDLFETGRQNCYLKYQDTYPDVLSVFRIFISSQDIHAENIRGPLLTNCADAFKAPVSNF